MAAAKRKTEASAPEKLDPLAPAAMPAEAEVRGRASRPTFRRGGLVFGDRDWTPIFPEEIGAIATRAILADPVIVIQGKVKGDWTVMPAEIRAGMIDALLEPAEAEAREAAEKAETETPAA